MSSHAEVAEASSRRMRATLARCRLALLFLATVGALVGDVRATLSLGSVLGFAAAWAVGGLGAVDARRTRRQSDPVVVLTAAADDILAAAWIAAFPQAASAAGLTALAAAGNAVLLKGIRLGSVGVVRCAAVSSAFWMHRSATAVTLRQYATVVVTDVVASMLVARLASEERRRGRGQAAAAREAQALAAALRRQRAIHEATRAVAAASGLDEALAAICSAAGQLLDAQFATVLLAGGQDCRVRGHWNVPRIEGTELGMVSPEVAEQMPSGRVLATGEAVCIEDVTLHPHPGVRALAERYGWRACLSVPMVSREETIGSLNVYFSTPVRVDDEPRALAELLAAEAAGLVRTALLIEELREQAVTDSLTGLFNFRFARERMESLLADAARRQRPLSVLFVDVDNLKDVNDRDGHARGDALLRTVAQTLRAHLRPVDIAARAGGDEFIVILPETDAHGALSVAVRLRAALHGELDDALSATVSIGCATAPVDGTTVDGLVRAADLAMYAAKRTGRDRVVPAGTSRPLTASSE
jgi:diguanylate cyclase (GGDEF)-like protein